MMVLFVYDDDDDDTCDDDDDTCDDYDPTVVLLQNFSNGSLHILISSVNIYRYLVVKKGDTLVGEMRVEIASSEVRKVDFHVKLRHIGTWGSRMQEELFKVG